MQLRGTTKTTHTRYTSPDLHIAEAMLIRTENSFRLDFDLRLVIVHDITEMLTSTKFAQLPSSSTPRVLNRVPARFQPSLDMSESVASIGAPFVGGAGKANVETPT